LLPAEDTSTDLRYPDEEFRRHTQHTGKEVAIRRVGIMSRFSKLIRAQAVRKVHGLGQPAGDQLGVELEDLERDPIAAYSAVAGRANRAS